MPPNSNAHKSKITLSGISVPKKCYVWTVLYYTVRAQAREACAKTFRNELWNCPSAELEQTGAGLVTHWYGEHGPSRQLDREWLVKVQNGGSLQFRSHHPALGFGQLLRSGIRSLVLCVMYE